MESKPIRILLVEDNPADVRIITEMLKEVRHSRFEVIPEGTLAKGLERFGKDTFDIVILDLSLPDSHGIETLHKLQKQVKAPVILMTGTEDEELAVQAVQEGAQDYIVKGQTDGNLLARAVRYAIERKKIRDRLIESEQRIRMITDNMMDMIVRLNLDGVMEYVSPSNKTILGYEPEEMIGKTIFDFVHPDDLDRIMDETERALENKRMSRYEARIRHADGHYVWLEANNNFILGSDGNSIGAILSSRDVTDRHKAEEELKKSEENYRGLFENLLEGVFRSTLDGQLESANPALVMMLGYESEDELKGIGNLRQLYVNPDERNILVKSLESQGKIQNFEIKLKRKDGTIITVLENAYIKKDANGRMKKYEGSLLDISHRKQAEKLLQESEEKYRSIFNLSPDLVALVDLEGNVAEINDSVLGITSMKRDEIVGKPFMELGTINDEDLERYMEVFSRLVNGEKVGPLEIKIISKDKKTRWLDVHASLLKKDTEIEAIHVIARDITERKKAEDEKRLLVEMLNITPAGVIIHDFDGKFLYVNDTMLKLHGYTREEILAMSIQQLNTQESVANIEERMNLIGEKGEAQFEVSHFRKDGTTFPLMVYAKVVPWMNKKAILSISTDITERKKSVEEIRRNFDTVRVINWLLSLSLQDIPLENIMKQTLDDILSISWLSLQSRGAILLAEEGTGMLRMMAKNGLSPPIEKSCARVPFGKCHCGRAASTKELQYSPVVGKDHEITYEGIIPHGHYCVPILFAGKTLGVINIYIKENHTRDKKEEDFLTAIANTLAGIIERKRIQTDKENMQNHLIQSEKMASMGQLIAGIAHEINNPLTAILGYSMELSRQIKETGTSKIPFFEHFPEDLDTIREAAERCGKITKALLAYARMSSSMKEKVSLPEILDATLLFLNPELRMHRIKLVKNIEKDVPPVFGNPTELQQVIINLVVNASDAMQGGGTLTISVFNTNGSTVFSVQDTGTGIPKENREKIFEPFFTTKAPGKSTGLGLAVVDGIVKTHNGTISIESEVGKGTKFTIKLPAYDAAQQGGGGTGG